MKIDAFLTPLFPEKETLFDDSVIIMMDVLRASTTICSALHNGAKEVIPVETTDKAVHIYSSLSKESRFLGGERNSVKPSGFDAGNSPIEYTSDLVSGRTVILTTTNGTKIFQKAKQAKLRIVGGFVNISSVIDYLVNYFKGGDAPQNIFFLCAGNEGRLSYEDTVCAGAFINEFEKKGITGEMSDSAFATYDLFRQHEKDLSGFLKTRDHAIRLLELGFVQDVDIALSYDYYPVVPIINGTSIKIANSTV